MEGRLAGIIEWPDYLGKDKDIVWKHPSEAIRWGSHLIVHEYEAAAFFRDGKMYDVFTAGRHVLTSANAPLISRAFRGLLGDTPFKSTIFFVSTREFAGQFGGRSQTQELWPLVYNGQYWYKVVDATLFVNEVVGGLGKFTTEEVINFLRSFVNQNVMKNLAKYGMGTVFTEGLDASSSRTKVAIEDQFSRFGMDLYDLKFGLIDTEPEYRNYASMIRQGVDPTEVLRMWTLRESSKELAKSPGAGLGAGLILPQMFGQPPASTGSTQERKDEKGKRARTVEEESPAPPKEDPLNVLKLRLARGEITKDQYQELKKLLEEG